MSDPSVIAAQIKAVGSLIVAAIALLGSVFTSVVAYFGARMRKDYEKRTLELKVAEAKRLELETAIRAVGLLSTAGGNSVSEPQRASALFILAEQGQTHFALTLLQPMWSARELQPASATWLLDKALTSGDRNAADQAATILLEHAEDLLRGDGGFEWPSSIDFRWDPKLSIYGRECLIHALFRVLRARPLDDWGSDHLAGALANLVLIEKLDENPELRAAATQGAQLLAWALHEREGDDFRIEMAPGYGILEIGDVQHLLEDDLRTLTEREGRPAIEISNASRDAICALKRWKEGH